MRLTCAICLDDMRHRLLLLVWRRGIFHSYLLDLWLRHGCLAMGRCTDVCDPSPGEYQSIMCLTKIGRSMLFAKLRGVFLVRGSDANGKRAQRQIGISPEKRLPFANFAN